MLLSRCEKLAAVRKVVEATTANGLCTIRVRALPLPAQLASILDNHADLLMRTFASERDALAESNALSHSNAGNIGNVSDSQHAGSAVPEQAPSAASEAAETNGHSSTRLDLEGLKRSDAGLVASGLSLQDSASRSESAVQSSGTDPQPGSQQEQQQQHASSAGDLARSVARRGKSADIGQLQKALMAAAKEAGPPAEELLQRAWMLGPHRVSILRASFKLSAEATIHLVV